MHPFLNILIRIGERLRELYTSASRKALILKVQLWGFYKRNSMRIIDYYFISLSFISTTPKEEIQFRALGDSRS